MASVMVVEDNSSYRDLVHLLCRMDGHEVIEAGSAEEALGLLDRQNVDLFIVDQALGGLTGCEFIDRVRARERFQRTPILILSAAEVRARRNAVFLRKPADNAEVIAAVRRLLPPWSPAGPMPGWA